MAASALAFAVSAVLTLLGILVAIVGIFADEEKAGFAGFVLLVGAGIFAALCCATRRRAGSKDE